MAKCSNCGAEIEIGARFCGECGTPVPEQSNQGEYLLRYMDTHGQITSRGISQVLVLNGVSFQCFCHLRNDQRNFQFSNVIDITPFDTGVTTRDIKALFVQRNVDGSELLVPKQDSPAMSIGNKNVISGDVIQQKNTYNVQGHIINETQSDETKLVKTCSVCGIHVANDSGYTCPNCQKFVCPNHFDTKRMLCHSCRDFAKNSAKMEYYVAYTNMLQSGNGLISIENRRALEETKVRLGLSDDDVASVESSIKVDAGLTRIEKMELQSAMQQIIQGNTAACIAKIEKMYNEHPGIIEVAAVYQRALKYTDLETLKKVVKKFSVESVLSQADLNIQAGNLYAAEKKILETREYAEYVSDPLLICEEAYYRTVVGAVYGKDDMLQKANELLDSIALSEENPYLKEFVGFVRKLIAVVSGAESLDSLATLAPYWKKMVKPVVAAKKNEPAKGHAAVKAVSDSIQFENVNSLVASWKQQVADGQQKLLDTQKALQDLAAQHQEADALREQERAKEEVAFQNKVKAIAAGTSRPSKDADDDVDEIDDTADSDDGLTEEEREFLAEEQARKAAEKAHKEEERLRKALERENEKARKEEERLRKVQEREAEKARKEAERVRRAELAASVQPFAVTGEYSFKYRDKLGVVSEKLGSRVFVADGLRFRCCDPRDPMGSAKTFLFEGVVEIKERDDSETTTDALELFRQHDLALSDADDPFLSASARNPFASDSDDEEEDDPFASDSDDEEEEDPFVKASKSFNDAASRLSQNLNAANENLRKSSANAQAEMLAHVKGATKVVKKTAKGCLFAILGFIVFVIVVGVISALISGSPLDDYYQDSIKYEKLVDSRDKQEYRVIQIGPQKWIAQNMNYATGASICDSCDLYGRLYTYDDAKNSCPTGFTLPTYADMEILKATAGNARTLLSKKGWGGAGMDKFGFAAIPGGFYSFKDGKIKRRGEITDYWAVTDYGDYAVRMKLDADKEDISMSGLIKHYAFSVRCISKATSVDLPAANDIVIDGRNEKIIGTVTIGNQKWLASNMNVKMSKSYCPEDDEANCDAYGRLYEWSVATKACPIGYRLPNAADFEQLARSSELYKFNPVYAGFRNAKGGYELLNVRSDLWSASVLGSNARYWFFKNGESKLTGNKFSKSAAMSVRCIEGALEQNFTYSQFIDERDGQIYKTVNVGKQVWMAQNLNIELEDSYCYDNNEENCSVYGRLYQWYTALEACPDGFRLPTDKDWQELKNFVSSNGDGRIGSDLRSVDLWKAGPGLDLFGLGIVPSGYYGFEKDEFGRLGERSYMWSASEVNADSAAHWAVVGDQEYFVKVTVFKKNGRAVRCVKGR